MASELKVDTIKHTNNTTALSLDTSGNITLAGSANNLGTVSAGTFNGTVGTSATVPASLSGLKLVKSYSGNLNGNSHTHVVDGAFTTSYTDYFVVMRGKLTNNSNDDSTLHLRLSKSDNTQSSSDYYSVLHGKDQNNTARGDFRNSASSMYLVNGVDYNYEWTIYFKVDKPATNNPTIMTGSQANFRGGVGLFESSFAGFHNTNYEASGFSLCWGLSGTTSTLEIKIYGADS